MIVDRPLSLAAIKRRKESLMVDFKLYWKSYTIVRDDPK